MYSCIHFIIFSAAVRDTMDASYEAMGRRIRQTIDSCNTRCTVPPTEWPSNKTSSANGIMREKRQVMATVYTILKYTERMFRVINSLTSVYDHFTQPSFDQLMEEINHIEDQLNQVQSSLNELAKSISDSSMRKQYVSSQRVVMESVRITYYYVNVTTELANGNKHLTQEDLNYWRTEINKWGSMLRESVSFLMDGFNGVNILAGDIIESIVAIEGEVDLINRIFITY